MYNTLNFTLINKNHQVTVVKIDFESSNCFLIEPEHIERCRLLGMSSETHHGGQTVEGEQCSVSGAAQEVALISMRPSVFEQRWRYMLDHISTDHSTLAAMHGICFEKLVVRDSLVASMYRTR